METKSIERLQQLHPKVRNIAISAYYEACKATPVGIHPYITQTGRTFKESDDLYALGRTKVNPDGKSAKKPMGNIVSNAKGGQSVHNFYCAFDFVIQKNGEADWNVDHNWMVVVNIFKAHGFEWGGDWKSLKDFPHLQMTFGLTVSQMKAKYDAGETFIDNGIKYISI